MPGNPTTRAVLNITPRVQVLKNQILTQNLSYNYYYPKPKYLIIGYMDPSGYRVPVYTANPWAAIPSTCRGLPDCLVEQPV